MLSNTQIHTLLNNLKYEEGVSFKLMANAINVEVNTLYFYRRCKQYPIEVRLTIESVVRKMFGDEVINEYCE